MCVNEKAIIRLWGAEVAMQPGCIYVDAAKVHELLQVQAMPGVGMNHILTLEV